MYSQTPLNPFMNGLLAIAKPEHVLMPRVDEGGSVSPVHSSFSLKRESMGDDGESGIDVNTVVGLAPSESPSSEGAGSSVSEDGPIFNTHVTLFSISHFVRKFTEACTASALRASHSDSCGIGHFHAIHL